MELPFVKKWKIACREVVAQMNDALKHKTDKSLRHRQHLQTFTTDVLTVTSIKQKMVTLLHNAGFRIFPALSSTKFWVKMLVDDRQILKFCRLPVPTDRTTAILTVSNRGSPIRYDSNTKAMLDLETKIKVRILVCLIELTNLFNRLLTHSSLAIFLKYPANFVRTAYSIWRRFNRTPSCLIRIFVVQQC